jgi:hypothetical protein
MEEQVLVAELMRTLEIEHYKPNLQTKPLSHTSRVGESLKKRNIAKFGVPI